MGRRVLCGCLLVGLWLTAGCEAEEAGSTELVFSGALDFVEAEDQPRILYQMTRLLERRMTSAISLNSLINR